MNSIQNIMRFSQVYAELHTDVLTAGTDAYDYIKGTMCSMQRAMTYIQDQPELHTEHHELCLGH